MTAPRMAALKSLLSVDGGAPRSIEAAFLAGADAVIIDLEGRAGASGRSAIRAASTQAPRHGARARLYLKVRAAETIHVRGHLEALPTNCLHGIILAQIESADALETAGALLAELEETIGTASGSIELMPLMESPNAIASAGAICTGRRRIRRIAFGAGDYCRSLNILRTIDEGELDGARAALVSASKLAGLEAPVDTPFPHVSDCRQFRRIAERGRDMGFQGKICLDAGQVAIANEVFAGQRDR